MSATYNIRHYKTIARVEHTHFWFRARNHLLGKLIRRYLPAKSTFMEVGFGTGIVLSMIERLGYALTGLDVNGVAREFAQKQTNAHLVIQSIYSYTTSKRYDAVGAFDVLEHQQDDGLFLRKCADLLKPGGYLFLSVPAGKWLWSDLDISLGHKRRYEIDQLRELLKRCGFQILFWNHWQVATLPIFFLWRLVLLRTGAKDIVGDYLRPPPKVFNWFFYWMLRAEELFFFRLRAPAGASIVICARKK